MPSKRSSNDLVLFTSTDPQQLVQWLCETYGFHAILRAVAQCQPTGGTATTPTKRAYKKRGSKKGAKRGAKKGAKKSGGKQGGGETGNQ
jgi:hypothetical protein